MTFSTYMYTYCTRTHTYLPKNAKGCMAEGRLGDGVGHTDHDGNHRIEVELGHHFWKMEDTAAPGQKP